MYEFHGWCALAESTSNRAWSDVEIDEIRLFVDGLKWANGFCDLRAFNGEYFLHFGGFQNRPRQEAKDLTELFALIGEVAPGSYGLLYWRDDEDPTPPGRDQWRVRTLAKGKTEDRFDPFLSPSVPVIEEPPKS